jgi:hypothetical protein
MLLSIVFGLFLQVPVNIPANNPVVIGLKDGQKLALDSAQFTGFIETRDGGDVLLYRQKDFHGELKLDVIERIDFNYKKGRPYILALTLRNGKKLNVESDKRDFVMIRGATESGFVTIKNPDPISSPVHISTSAANRKHDQTIQYLEFPR